MDEGCPHGAGLGYLVLPPSVGLECGDDLGDAWAVNSFWLVPGAED